MEEKMIKLKQKLVENLKGYSFEELKEMLDSQSEPEVREAIMDAMDKYHQAKFYEYMEEY